MKILLLALMVVGLVAWSSTAASSDVVKVATFTAGLPEGLAVGPNGDLYVGLVSGEIRKVTPDGEVSSFVTLDPGQGFLLGLAFNQQDVLKEKEINQVFLLTRVMYKAVLELHYKRLAIFYPICSLATPGSPPMIKPSLSKLLGLSSAQSVSASEHPCHGEVYPS
jgi:hypothetical protein